VQFVNVPEVGVPKIGVTKVGEVANTRAPEPVSSVIAAARFALDGVARNVAIPEAKPETPVLIGKPVQLVNVPALGVAIFGVAESVIIFPLVPDHTQTLPFVPVEELLTILSTVLLLVPPIKEPLA
jgi:hypothetical protein